MGTTAHIVVVGGGPEHLARARARIADLEARWTRFRPDSELERVNACPGRPVIVSDETFAAVASAVAAWHDTAGSFDPTVRDAIDAAGYDRDFASIEVAHSTLAAPAPGCADVHLDPTVRAITLPEGVRLDLGGIGKGLGADLVTGELLAAGAAGCCVNLGGDLRVTGEAPDPNGWVLAVEHPDRPDHEVAHLALTDGGVATSTPRRRRWRTATGTAHHLLDPATGRPAPERVAAVTVVAGSASRAEVLAKVAYLAGDDAARVIAAAGATGGLLDAADAWHPFPGWEHFAR